MGDMNKAYWIIVVLGLAIIAAGTAIYLQKKNSSLPTEAGSTNGTQNDTQAGITAGVEATAATLDELSNDIESITEDTGSTNTDDETPTL